MQRYGRTKRAGLLAALLATSGLGLATPAAADDGLQWHRQFGSDDREVAHAVATDAVGNVYLTGWTSGALGGPKQGYFPDAWVAKYDAAGHQLWKRQFGSDSYDSATGVVTDAMGNVYLTGSTEGALGGPSQGGNDAWVAKYDAAGHQVWKRQFGAPSDDRATGVATDATGNVYLTGFTEGALGGPSQGGNDAWVAKYDAAGNLQWTQQIGTPRGDYAESVATDATGNVYLTGTTDGALGGPYYLDNWDAWVAKYDAAGHWLWTQQIGTPRDESAYGVATDAAGNVYLTGYTSGALAGPNMGNVDAWVAKYDADGHQLWTQQLGTPADEWAYGVATDTTGNVYLTGMTDGALGGPRLGGVHDAWLAKYDGAGHLLWTQQIGTPKHDGAYGVATVTKAGIASVYVAGFTMGSLCGPNHGGADAFVAKYSAVP